MTDSKTTPCKTDVSWATSTGECGSYTTYYDLPIGTDSTHGQNYNDNYTTTPVGDLNRQYCYERLPCGLCRRTNTPCPYGGYDKWEVTC